MPVLQDGTNLLDKVGVCDAERRLLTAIRCVPACRGLLLALLLVEAALEAYFKLTGLPRVAAWLAVAKSLIERVEQLETEGVVGLRSAAHGAQSSVYTRLCASYAARLKPSCHERALALLGRLILDACAQDRPLHEAPVAGWYTLIQGGGRSGDWKEFVCLVPIALDELHTAHKTAKTPGLVDLLSHVIAALGRPLVEPARESLGTGAPGVTQPTHEQSPPDEPTSPGGEQGNSDELADGEDDPAANSREGGKRGPLDTKKSRENPIAWLVKAANYAPHLQRFDLIGHIDRLHPLVTQACWKNYRECFQSKGAQEKVWGAFAHVTQRLAQPARIGLALRLDGSRSTKLDVAGGAVVWNLLAALSASADPALDALKSEHGTYALTLPLDADIADYLRQCLTLRPTALTLAELLGIDTDPEFLKIWLRRYRKFLQDEGDSVQVAYDARFATSLGDAYRHIGAGEAMAFLRGLDFDALPLGMAHYITLDPEFTTTVERELFKFMGWKMPAGWTAKGPEGSPTSITPSQFQAGWAIAQQRTNEAHQHLKASRTPEEFQDAFNHLSRLRLLAVITLAAHRGTLLSRLTWRSLYQFRDVVHLFDKNVGEFQSNRCIPVHSLLDGVLAAWQLDLSLMEAKAAELGLTLATEGRRALPTGLPTDPVFFVMRLAKGNSTTHIERAALRVGPMEVEAETCFQRQLNIGRHFLISQLVARRVSTWHVRVLSGHFRIHAEAFADGMHVPPAQAFATLKSDVEGLLDDLDLAPVACLDQASPGRSLIPPCGDLPSASDPYLAPSANNVFRILPPPFDDHTPVALQAVECLRKKLCGVTGLSGPAEFTAAQTLYGLWDRVDQEAVFGGLKSHVFKVKEVAVAAWTRPASAQPIVVRLNDRVVIAMARIQDRASAGTWQKSAEEVGRWARDALPLLQWPEGDFDAFLRLLSLALRYRRFHFAPNVLTASSSALPSATFSRRSILRAAGCDPHPMPPGSSLGRALREGSPRRIKDKDKSGPLHDVANALREVSRLEYPLGGEIQRANDWQEKLTKVDIRDDQRAKCLKRMHEKEIELRHLTAEGAHKKDADEASTLAGHLSDILIAMGLLSPSDDISEFTSAEWSEWIDASKKAIDELGKNTKAVMENKTRHFGLRRLVRIARMLGWAAPRGMFSDGGPRLTFDGLRKAAASVALLETDHPQIQQLLADHFDDWPVLQWKAELAAKLHQHHPLRSSEQAALIAACLVRTSQMLMISPGAFSHLKTVHAYRLLECAKQIIELLDKLEDQAIELDGKYLFLNDSGWDWSDARAIDEALVSAAAQVTGEAAVRKHSFRGSAFLRLVWPGWEQVTRSVFDADTSPHALAQLLIAEWNRGFGAGALAARSAGHGLQLVGLVYYAAAWPLMFAAQSQALLKGLAPDSGLIEGVLGSTGSIRNEKSAAKAAKKEFDVWAAVARRCVKRMNLPPLSPSDARAVISPRTEGSDVAEPPLMSRILLVAGLIAKGDRDSLAAKLGIPKPYAALLEAALPPTARLRDITKRRNGFATPSQLAEDREFIFGKPKDKFLSSKDGNQLLANLVAHPLPVLISLLNDLAPYRRNPRDPAPTATQLMARLRSHLQVLSAPLRLQIRFSKKYGALLNAEQLHALGPRLVMGTEDTRAGKQPQSQVMPEKKLVPPGKEAQDENPAQHQQSELIGRLTVATRIFIEAIEITHKAAKGPTS